MGAIGVSNYEGVTSPAYDILRMRKDLVPEFYDFLFRCGLCFTEFRRHSRGIMDMRLRLYFEDFGQLLMPYPPLCEQTAIVSFLNAETAKIDKLVEEQRRLIELLTEKRQAVISHAVTKGLNPDAPMKPSGIEWLGDVPAHWEVLAYRHLVTRVSVGIAEAATHAYADEGVPIVRSTNIKSGEIDESEMLFIKREFAMKLDSKALLSGDIVTTRTGANVGVSAVVPPSLHMSQCFTLLISSPKPVCNPYFYNYFINSTAGKHYVELTAWGSGQHNISVPILQEMMTVHPPLDEQSKIVEFIELSSLQYADLVFEAQQGIDLLEERRTALISAAVTGKIDVRSLVEHKAG
jgi:type I restriction enzyme S subunit